MSAATLFQHARALREQESARRTVRALARRGTFGAASMRDAATEKRLLRAFGFGEGVVPGGYPAFESGKRGGGGSCTGRTCAARGKSTRTLATDGGVGGAPGPAMRTQGTRTPVSHVDDPFACWNTSEYTDRYALHEPCGTADEGFIIEPCEYVWDEATRQCRCTYRCQEESDEDCTSDPDANSLAQGCAAYTDTDHTDGTVTYEGAGVIGYVEGSGCRYVWRCSNGDVADDFDDHGFDGSEESSAVEYEGEARDACDDHPFMDNLDPEQLRSGEAVTGGGIPGGDTDDVEPQIPDPVIVRDCFAAQFLMSQRVERGLCTRRPDAGGWRVWTCKESVYGGGPNGVFGLGCRYVVYMNPETCHVRLFWCCLVHPGRVDPCIEATVD